MDWCRCRPRQTRPDKTQNTVSRVGGRLKPVWHRNANRGVAGPVCKQSRREGGPRAWRTLTRAGCHGDTHRINLFYDQKKSSLLLLCGYLIYFVFTGNPDEDVFWYKTFSSQTHYWSFIGLKSYFLAITCRQQLSHQNRRHTAGYHEDRYWFIDVPEKLWWLSESAVSLVQAAELCSRPCLFSSFGVGVSARRSAPPVWEERCCRRALASQRFSVSHHTDERTRVTGCTKPRLCFACWSWAGPGPSRGSLLSQNRSTRRRRTSAMSR